MSLIGPTRTKVRCAHAAAVGDGADLYDSGSFHGLAETSVDLKTLARDAPALIGGEEQRHVRDVVGRHRVGNGLTRAQLGDRLVVRVPQPALTLRDHHPWRYRVDADAVGPERPGQGVGEADDRGLCR